MFDYDTTMSASLFHIDHSVALFSRSERLNTGSKR
jgi:hypothetical protein